MRIQGTKFPARLHLGEEVKSIEWSHIVTWIIIISGLREDKSDLRDFLLVSPPKPRIFIEMIFMG